MNVYGGLIDKTRKESPMSMSYSFSNCDELCDQRLSGRKGLICLYFHITVHHWSKSGQKFKQGRNLEAEAGAKATERCCLLSCFCGLLSLLPCGTQDRHPREDTTHNSLVPPSSKANTTLWICLQPSLMEVFLSLGSVFSVDSSLCRGDTETSQERINLLIVFMHMSSVAMHIRTWMNLQTTLTKEDAGRNRTYCVFPLCQTKEYNPRAWNREEEEGCDFKTWGNLRMKDMVLPLVSLMLNHSCWLDHTETWLGP